MEASQFRAFDNSLSSKIGESGCLICGMGFDWLILLKELAQKHNIQAELIVLALGGLDGQERSTVAEYIFASTLDAYNRQRRAEMRPQCISKERFLDALAKL